MIVVRGQLQVRFEELDKTRLVQVDIVRRLDGVGCVPRKVGYAVISSDRSFQLLGESERGEAGCCLEVLLLPTPAKPFLTISCQATSHMDCSDLEGIDQLSLS